MAFHKNTGENDPYDMSIAPLNLFENQVIPIGLHNLSKSFRPNISTIRILSLGTKLIRKWKFEKRNNTLEKKYSMILSEECITKYTSWKLNQDFFRKILSLS